MDDMLELLRPSWGAEYWIKEGWREIGDEDRALITSRVDELFKNGLPFELQHDRLLYIYAFSLLTQLEVLAIQVPLRFKDKMSSEIHQKQMHQQLLDEIFHGIVFTKILYLLSAPNATPPDYNDKIEIVCNFIRKEQCPKTAVVLLNLIGEGWIEEIFLSLKEAGIASNVFDVILIDEHRHVCEAELYQALGLPDQKIIKQKLEQLEDLMLTHVFLQYKYMYSLGALIGEQVFKRLLSNLQKKHDTQLKKLNLTPSVRWKSFMHVLENIVQKYKKPYSANQKVKHTASRKVFMTQWDEPGDPTMVGHFDLDISCLDIFNNVFPSETLTVLVLQATSKAIASDPSFRNFLHHGEVYSSNQAYVSLVVQLPGCDEHIGMIELENCHQISAKELAFKIKQYIGAMVYCYKTRQKMEADHPFLKKMNDSFFHDFAFGTYPYPIPGVLGISVSNIHASGLTQGTSPLRKTEAIKMTLFEADRKLIWNRTNGEFEARDILPVSISADHRVFGGNTPAPKLVRKSFQEMFACLLQDRNKDLPNGMPQEKDLLHMINEYIRSDLELGYYMLLNLQTKFVDLLNNPSYFENKSWKNFIKNIKGFYEPV